MHNLSAPGSGIQDRSSANNNTDIRWQLRFPSSSHPLDAPVTQELPVSCGADLVTPFDEFIQKSGVKGGVITIIPDPDKREEFRKIKGRNPQMLRTMRRVAALVASESRPLDDDEGEYVGGTRGRVTARVSNRQAQLRGAPITTGVTREQCASCHQTTHELAICVRPGRDGSLYGCPMCNSVSHQVDHCERWATMSTAAKFDVLVEKRARMVPLKTDEDRLWYDVYKQHRRAEMPSLHQDFPLTKEYGMAYRDVKLIVESWEAFYERPDRAILPVDYKTKDLAAVDRLFSGALYQKKEPDTPTRQLFSFEYGGPIVWSSDGYESSA
ncbi:methyltransferase domain-containing protein [Purpureocillium lavendulum]|uniref:Methyltransferase domain-containing protein n=1 Tax=Purpureocillium lavendulum TaxID=1247861 RepID=A0AB34FTJ0_9HYPO|nr:methyltransferase domain-containing protein [Purpureocillium lavendulum]